MSTRSHYPLYSNYWAPGRIKQSLEDGTVIRGRLMSMKTANPIAFVKHPANDADVCIFGRVDANRAIHGDLVCVRIRRKRRWRVFDHLLSDEIKNQSKSNSVTTVDDVLAKDPDFFVRFWGKAYSDKLTAGLDTITDPADPDSNHYSPTSLPWWLVIQRCGHVVAIIEELHPRYFVGRIKPKAKGGVLFVPLERRYPLMNIEKPSLEKVGDSEYDGSKLVTARMITWPQEKLWPNCHFVDYLHPPVVVDITPTDLDGGSDNYSSPDNSLLARFNTHLLASIGRLTTSFPASIDQTANSLVESLDWAKEWEMRRDLTEQAVFSIDPPSARDLDDALHIRVFNTKDQVRLVSRKVKGAVYEVGVHIADVSYFVRPESSLDAVARHRGTSLYLVDQCIPMLPHSLSEQCCSLTTGANKLAFSLLFAVSVTGEIVDTWFGRTIIRSCVQLSYDHVQAVIDNPELNWTDSKFPEIEQPHSPEVVIEAILRLHSLASQRRNRRYQPQVGGSLRFDQVKPAFAVTPSPLYITSCHPFLPKDANWLIEEWMLAANMQVARLLTNQPKTSNESIEDNRPFPVALRRHLPPLGKQLVETCHLLRQLDLPIDPQSAGSIQRSLEALSQPSTLDQQLADHLSRLLSLEPCSCSSTPTTNCKLLFTILALIKTMTTAEYLVYNPRNRRLRRNTIRHYALNVNAYTHFTSPIRRYVDILVHRQLARLLVRQATQRGDPKRAAWYAETIEEKPVPEFRLDRILQRCNARKLDADKAGELSRDFFIHLWIKQNVELRVEGMVLGVFSDSFDFYIFNLGITQRIRASALHVANWHHHNCSSSSTSADKDSTPNPISLVVRNHGRIALVYPSSCQAQKSEERAILAASNPIAWRLSLASRGDDQCQCDGILLVEPMLQMKAILTSPRDEEEEYSSVNTELYLDDYSRWSIRFDPPTCAFCSSSSTKCQVAES